jgi:hypothetical protein
MTLKHEDTLFLRKSGNTNLSLQEWNILSELLAKPTKSLGMGLGITIQASLKLRYTTTKHLMTYVNCQSTVDGGEMEDKFTWTNT